MLVCASFSAICSAMNVSHTTSRKCVALAYKITRDDATDAARLGLVLPAQWWHSRTYGRTWRPATAKLTIDDSNGFHAWRRTTSYGVMDAIRTPRTAKYMKLSACCSRHKTKRGRPITSAHFTSTKNEIDLSRSVDRRNCGSRTASPVCAATFITAHVSATRS
ncbi:hypothetical protein H310_09990 [Aphanomyces invadans]|uniref:Uncharacterized protein n=1 Tax=Aphanomyces invadans TaxID=157072 RepID=A0A024TU94_9STRA|nr:hypothetical protein H310_09990 [Aphanomyces invadans]ETV97201.1 hypothetical protein H310_09990 [Aphanomyces invadans]|eukprot:XP_008874447.1 hypothetical protein H310_09990 [Aphanomyces invadans]